jgi:hypothetical protein
VTSGTGHYAEMETASMSLQEGRPICVTEFTPENVFRKNRLTYTNNISALLNLTAGLKGGIPFALLDRGNAHDRTSRPKGG